MFLLVGYSYCMHVNTFGVSCSVVDHTTKKLAEFHNQLILWTIVL